MAKKPKSTTAKVIDRVAHVRDLLLQGYTRSQILRQTEHWGIKTRQMDQYIANATAEIAEITQAKAEHTLSMLTSNLWKLYRENTFLRPSVSRLALHDIAKLHGLDKIDINLNITRELKDASDEELMAAIQGAA